MARTGNTDPRAGGAPLGRAVTTIAGIIDARATSVVLTRPSKSTGSLDETKEQTNDHTEQMWLVSPDESISQDPAGERISGDLRALTLDGADVQKDDRLTYGGVEYEVDTIVGRPDDANSDGTTHNGVEYFDITLMRRN